MEQDSGRQEVDPGRRLWRTQRYVFIIRMRNRHWTGWRTSVFAASNLTRRPSAPPQLHI
jgi:hypothetical protein